MTTLTSSDSQIIDDPTQPLFDIVVGDGEKMIFFDFSNLPKRSLRVVLQGNSELKIFSILVLKQKRVSRDYNIILEGEGSNVVIKGICNLRENQKVNTKVQIEHKAPNTHSDQHFKGVLRGKSRSTFDGKIIVAANADQSKAYQLNNHLILDEGASASAKPQLEIFTDDVKASHGATISNLSDDELFYLCTRGISEKAGREYIAQGFLDEMLRQIPINLRNKYEI